MKRLTTDHPEGNFETMLNFVYQQDHWAHIRGDGDNENVPLTDWIKRQCLANGCDEFLYETPEEINEAVTECAMDAFGDGLCPIALAYTFASQACHLRDRLKMYEDVLFDDVGHEVISPGMLAGLRFGYGQLHHRQNAGYSIIDSVTVGGCEFVLGASTREHQAFVTWQCRGRKDYFFGHYFDSRHAAEKDLLTRAMEELESREPRNEEQEAPDE